MNLFYTTVIGIAILILFIILIIIGVMIYNSKNSMVYPPTALDCPNYWVSDKDSNNNHICYVPNNGVNVGIFDGKNTPGYNSNTNGKYINFNDSKWGAAASNSTCAKYKWCKKNSILWDGISNFNGCDT